jgi:hypothetical protein
MTSKPRSGGKGDNTHKPRVGTGDAGAPFDPRAEPGPEKAEPGEPRSAPAPGVPMSKEDYERLKERARTERPSARSQANPSRRPKGKRDR